MHIPSPQALNIRQNPHKKRPTWRNAPRRYTQTRAVDPAHSHHLQGQRAGVRLVSCGPRKSGFVYIWTCCQATLPSALHLVPAAQSCSGPILRPPPYSPAPRLCTSHYHTALQSPMQPVSANASLAGAGIINLRGGGLSPD